MSSEIIEKVRRLAFELSSRGTRPGFIAAGTQERAGEINHELVVMFNSEQDVSTTKRQVQKTDPVTGEIVREKHKHPVTDDDAYYAEVLIETGEISTQNRATAKGNIIRAMIQHLVAAAFGKTSFSDTDHEAIILKASRELPELCDKLQAIEGNTPVQDWKKRRETLNETVEDQMTVLYKKDQRTAAMTSPEIAVILECSEPAVRKPSNKVWQMFKAEKEANQHRLKQRHTTDSDNDIDDE